MRALKNLAGQTLVYGLGSMVPRLLNYVILTPYFTYMYNKQGAVMAEYGKVTELYAYIVFLMVVLTYGMETTYFRYINIEKDKQSVFSTILSSILFTSFAFVAVVLIFTGSIADFLKFSGEPYFIRMLAGIVAVEAISSIPFAKLRIENKARKFSILKILQVSLNIIIMLFIYNVLPIIKGSNDLLLNDSGILSCKFIFLANLISACVVLLFLLPELKDFKIRKFNWKLYGVLLIYSLPLLMSSLAGVVNETLDRSIFKHVIDNQEYALEQLAMYGANYKLASIVMIFVQMFRYAAEPFFFNYEKEKDSKYRYAQVMNIFTGFLILLSLVIILYIDILKYFIGSSYHEGKVIVPLIALAYVMYGILFNLSIWFKLSNKTAYAIIITSVGAFITVFINVKYIPEYSYHASAIAHVISYSAMVIVSYFLSRKFYPIPYNLGRLLSYFILGVSIFLLDKYISIPNTYLNFIFKTVLVLIFAIFVFWKENFYKIFLKKT